MATLTESSIYARKSLRYFIYFVIFIIIARFSLNIVITIYKKIFPPAPTPPTVAFDILTPLPFPEKEKINLNFSLETPEGGLPIFSDQADVYFMPKPSANLLSLDFSKSKVQKLGFNTDALEVSDSIYRFYHKSSPSNIEMDIISGSFSINYDLASDPSPLTVRPAQPEVGITQIRTFLSGANLMPPDITGIVKHKFLKAQGNGFIEALSLSDANLVRLDFFRRNYSDLPIVTNEPNKANIWFMVSGFRERGKDVIAGEYHYFSVDESQLATYPIKTSEMAWQELNSGNYYLASNSALTEGTNVKIRKIYLAYYDPGVYTEFFQPVVVFEGDNDFTAYVPAVTSDYYGK